MTPLGSTAGEQRLLRMAREMGLRFGEEEGAEDGGSLAEVAGHRPSVQRPAATQARVVLLKTFEAATGEELEDAYNTWRQDNLEEEFTWLSGQYRVDGGVHYLLVFYTE